MGNSLLVLGPDTLNPITWPNDATRTSITAPTAANTYVATWSQIVAAASMTSPFVLCGVTADTFRGTSTQVFVQIGTGAASSEVILDEFNFGGTVSGVVDDPVSLSIPHAQLLGPHYIPTGTRIAARQAQSHASAWSTSFLYLYGYSVATPQMAARIINAIQFYQGYATKGGVMLPSASTISLTHSGTAWTQGAWVEIDAAVDEDLMIEGIFTQPNTSGRDFIISLGVGAAGSEVMLPAFFPTESVGTTLPIWSFIPSPFPLYVPKGSRLVARQKALGTTGTTALAVKVTYLK